MIVVMEDNYFSGREERVELRCDQGKCVDHPDSLSAQVKDSCIWGDQPIIKYNTKSGRYEGDCPGFMARQGKTACETASVARSCCKTCEDLKTGVPGCPYGDKYSKCDSYTQSQICDNNRHLCCQFCHGYPTRRNADSEVSSIDLSADLPSGDLEVTDELKPKPDADSNTNNGGPTEQT
ncbi:hypothetical protein RRG08_029277 [Elysia crispata]|uniref:Uncharacterized protein n=1 Tax=Elysia crispata TaxID=231223 RepID=A0AAE1A5D5_9GAST|nr:hypothetical protein RRG08_029277 [Elysia crispata]